MAQKYLLTGGAYSGKTTLLQALRQKGFEIVPEAAEILIQEELEKTGVHPNILNRFAFVEKILHKRIELEFTVQDYEGAVFIDRGIPDGMAYYQLYGKEPSPAYHAAVQKFRYKKVFFLELLDGYVPNEVRQEKEETRVRVHHLLKETYRGLGYKVITVPVLPVEKRTELILNSIP
ncbi:ATP-binding protein [Candidatus Woesearchaeota archaeon]|nr:ATP-binding protein [Candidatus Woesearchaeota archaeon]